MAKADIGPKIGIEGEAEFKRQLADINNGLKTTQTEMQAVTSAYLGNEKSTEALTAENEVLEKELYSLNEKLAVQQQRLEACAQAYGEASPQTQKMQQAVNKTTAEINRTNAAIEKNNTQINANSTLLGKLGINVEAVGQKFGVSSSQMQKLTTALGDGAAECAIFTAAAVKLATELVKLSDAATQHGDEIATLATKYGMSAQSVQQLQYMAELTDVSVDTITGSMTRLTRSMDSARSGTGGAAEAFARLGVSVTNSDGSLRSANAVFTEAIDALGSVGNQTERDALAMDIFGKSAMELNPLIAQGSEGLRELAAEAANSGYVMSNQMVEALAAGDDATQKLDKAMDGLKNTIGAGVTPIVAGWKLILAEAADDMAVFIQNLAGMRDGADDVATAIDSASAALSNFKDLTAEDLLPAEQQSYKDYVDRALKYQQETGQQVTIYSPQAMQRGYQTGVTLQLDGYTFGKAATPYINGTNYTNGGTL